MDRRAQVTLEYVILFAVIVAALVVSQIYAKRGFQGKLREYADELSQYGYSPGGVSSGSSVAITNTYENSNTTHPSDTQTRTVVSTNTSQTTNVSEDLVGLSQEPQRW
jgi:uncharacterized protein (UPF0333 family)